MCHLSVSSRAKICFLVFSLLGVCYCVEETASSSEKNKTEVNEELSITGSQHGDSLKNHFNTEIQSEADAQADSSSAYGERIRKPENLALNQGLQKFGDKGRFQSESEFLSPEPDHHGSPEVHETDSAFPDIPRSGSDSTAFVSAAENQNSAEFRSLSAINSEQQSDTHSSENNEKAIENRDDKEISVFRPGGEPILDGITIQYLPENDGSQPPVVHFADVSKFAKKEKEVLQSNKNVPISPGNGEAHDKEKKHPEEKRENFVKWIKVQNKDLSKVESPEKESHNTESANQKYHQSTEVNTVIRRKKVRKVKLPSGAFSSSSSSKMFGDRRNEASLQSGGVQERPNGNVSSQHSSQTVSSKSLFQRKQDSNIHKKVQSSREYAVPGSQYPTSSGQLGIRPAKIHGIVTSYLDQSTNNVRMIQSPGVAGKSGGTLSNVPRNTGGNNNGKFIRQFQADTYNVPVKQNAVQFTNHPQQHQQHLNSQNQAGVPNPSFSQSLIPGQHGLGSKSASQDGQVLSFQSTSKSLAGQQAAYGPNAGNVIGLPESRMYFSLNGNNPERVITVTHGGSDSLSSEHPTNQLNAKHRTENFGQTLLGQPQLGTPLSGNSVPFKSKFQNALQSSGTGNGKGYSISKRTTGQPDKIVIKISAPSAQGEPSKHRGPDDEIFGYYTSFYENQNQKSNDAQTFELPRDLIEEIKSSGNGKQKFHLYPVIYKELSNDGNHPHSGQGSGKQVNGAIIIPKNNGLPTHELVIHKSAVNSHGQGHSVPGLQQQQQQYSVQSDGLFKGHEQFVQGNNLGFAGNGQHGQNFRHGNLDYSNNGQNVWSAGTQQNVKGSVGHNVQQFSAGFKGQPQGVVYDNSFENAQAVKNGQNQGQFVQQGHQNLMYGSGPWSNGGVSTQSKSPQQNIQPWQASGFQSQGKSVGTYPSGGANSHIPLNVKSNQQHSSYSSSVESSHGNGAPQAFESGIGHSGQHKGNPQSFGVSSYRTNDNFNNQINKERVYVFQNGQLNKGNFGTNTQSHAHADCDQVHNAGAHGQQNYAYGNNPGKQFGSSFTRKQVSSGYDTQITHPKAYEIHQRSAAPGGNTGTNQEERKTVAQQPGKHYAQAPQAHNISQIIVEDGNYYVVYSDGSQRRFGYDDVKGLQQDPTGKFYGFPTSHDSPTQAPRTTEIELKLPESIRNREPIPPKQLAAIGVHLANAFVPYIPPPKEIKSRLSFGVEVTRGHDTSNAETAQSPGGAHHTEHSGKF